MQPLEHTTVRVKVELAEAVPDGMVGTLHLARYDPDNTLGNEPSTPPSHNGHGRRDNAEDVELVEVLEKGAGANGTVDLKSIVAAILRREKTMGAGGYLVECEPGM